MFEKLARLFRKPAVAIASRCPARYRLPARADGPKVGLDGPASLGSVARWVGRLGYLWLCAGGAKAMFVAAADLSML